MKMLVLVSQKILKLRKNSFFKPRKNGKNILYTLKTLLEKKIILEKETKK